VALCALLLLGASFGPQKSMGSFDTRGGRIGFTADGPVEAGSSRLFVPYRSQFDKSVYERSNCGVAAIAMALEHFGVPVPSLELRESINAMTGNWWKDSGIAWRHLMLAVQGRGLLVDGPYAAGDANAFRPWTLDELLAQTTQGRPVIALVRYRTLPGHEGAEYGGDHYVVVLGTAADGRVVYHDPAFRGLAGAYRTTDRETFERAWSQTWIGQNRTAMVVYR
jgi:hypothetical protein